MAREDVEETRDAHMHNSTSRAIQHATIKGSREFGCHDYQVFGFTVNEVALVSSSLTKVIMIFANSITGCFSLWYRKVMDNKGQSYETLLENSTGFNNPNNIKYLCDLIGLGQDNHSNMVGLR